MTLVLTGVTGLRNRGVEALVRSAIHGFSRYMLEGTTVLSSDPVYDRIALDGIATVAADAPGYFRSGMIERYLREIAAAVRPHRHSLQAIDVLKSATAVIASGGDVFSSDYGSMHRHLGVIEMAQKLGKPTVFLAHSIGPFKTASEASMMRAALSRATLITVRERRSLDYVVQHLGISAERVKLAADVAFLLPPSAPRRIAALKRWLGLADAGYVTLAPSEGITSYSPASDRQAHDLAWTRTVERILAASDDDILIVPHVQEVRPASDDRRIASRIVEATGFNPRVRIASGELSASDFKGLIQGSRYLVGERMHACIAALSTAVPTIAIGYSVKARGIMEDMLGAELPLDELHVPIDRFVASEGLSAEIAAMAQRNDAIRERLNRAGHEARRLAEFNFVTLRDALAGEVKAAA